MSLDNQIKSATEERDELLQVLEKNIKNNPTANDKERSNRMMAKIEGLDHHINKLEDRAQMKAGSASPSGNNRVNGGTPLDESGKVRMYNANESLVNDFSGNNSKVGLGQYLRALVDKPRNGAEQEIIQNSTTSSGYELPTRISAELVDRLRANNPLLQENGAGARTVTIEGGDTKFVTIDSDMTASFHSEMVEETPDDPAFGSVVLSPHTLLAMTEISNELLQDSNNIEEALTTSFVGSLNDAMLDATFAATTSNGPDGLGTHITQTEEYTNGASPDFTNFVNAHGTLYGNNLQQEGRSHLLAPDVWTTLNNLTASDNQPLQKPFGIANTPEFTTSGVPAGESYVGDFSNVIFGMRLDINIRQYPAAAAKAYGSLWVAAMRFDISVFRPSALIRIEEAAV